MTRPSWTNVRQDVVFSASPNASDQPGRVLSVAIDGFVVSSDIVSNISSGM